MGIVIVEGVDRVGKTTLVKKLVDNGYSELNLKELPRPGQVVQEVKIKAVLACLTHMPRGNIVVDRFHLSEWVYGLLRRGYDSTSLVLYADRVLKGLGATLVYVEPVDIKLSSKLHGVDLTSEFDLYERYISYYNTMQVVYTDYNNLDWTVGQLCKLM